VHDVIESEGYWLRTSGFSPYGRLRTVSTEITCHTVTISNKAVVSCYCVGHATAD